MLPVVPQTVSLSSFSGNVGLVIVDASVGFTRSGALSDPESMVPMVQRIKEEYLRLYEALGTRLKVLCFLDTHHPDIPEPPYPPHGVVGTGEEEIDPELEFLLSQPDVTVIRKDCINGFVGAIENGRNLFVDWMQDNQIGKLLVAGDCTDICVSDFVVTALSARNHGLFVPRTVAKGSAEYVSSIVGLDIVVLSEACQTFNAPLHPREVCHQIGLWLMASRGAVICSPLVL